MRFTEIEVATSFGEMLIWSPNLCRTSCHNPVLLTDAIGYFSVRLHTRHFGYSELPEFVGFVSSSNSVSLGFVPSNLRVCVRKEEAEGSNPFSSTIFQKNDLERAKRSYPLACPSFRRPASFSLPYPLLFLTARRSMLSGLVENPPLLASA
jgi:hypothetical protein